MRRALLMLALAGCAGSADGSDVNDGGTGADGNTSGCVLAYDPADPSASPILPIRVYTTILNPQGVVTFNWTVTFGGTQVAYTQQAADLSQISFVAPDPGIYKVEVVVGGTPSCSYGTTNINVGAPGANADVFRLRTVPSPALAPPQETYIQVKGGAEVDRTIALDAGVSVTGLVKDSATNAMVAGYLKFMPRTMPTAFTELFSASTGMYTLRLLPVDHDVLVVPTSTALAPKLVTWRAAPMTTQLEVGPGTVVTGTVRGPSGAGLAGAKVQLYAGGVPSTLGTTAGDGTFSVRTDFPASASNVTVKVTAPATSGLPRLEATSAFNLAPAMQINYAASLATCDLANTPVQRAGVDQGGAQVSVVGSLAGVAGTINSINATNSVRVGATASGAGRLPAMLVPRGALSAVTELAMNDHAVSAIDTSACNVTAIDAPAMTTINGTTKKTATATLDAVRVEAEPIGVLALAGVSPIQVTSDASGAFALPLAAGGRYNVRFIDPHQRVAPLVASNVAPGGVPTNAVLPKALALTGKVTVATSMNPVIGASVQILCATCTGLETARPITETATDTISRYRIAVPDPGTM